MFDDALSVDQTEPELCATESDTTALISSCGCLGNCGMGPNVYGTKTDEVCRAHRFSCSPPSPLPSALISQAAFAALSLTPPPTPTLNPCRSSRSQVFRDVYKPKSARALLEAELGLEISDDAVKV